MKFAAPVGRRRRWTRSTAAGGGPIARPMPVACLGILASLCLFSILFQRHNALSSVLPGIVQDSEESTLDAEAPTAPVSQPNDDATILADKNDGVAIDARAGDDQILPVSLPSRFHNYTNMPVNEETDESRTRLRQLLSESVPPPVGLIHRASPPGHDAILGLAAYPKNMGTWKRLVGSLRNTGYDGHIIFGVHSNIPQEEEVYLKEMDVTYYEVEFVDCDESILVGGTNAAKDAVRTKCAKGYEHLTLEWGRFEMARRWLHYCNDCTGWNLVMDTRDVFFQAQPFASLPSASTVDGTKNGDDNDHSYVDGVADLLFIEEIAAHSSPVAEPHRFFQLDNPRYSSRTVPCYGRNHMRKFASRPVLCSGTIVGTRNGMHRFLSVLVDEFNSNNRGQKGACKNSVRGLTDQWTMNYLYYTGRFGDYSRTKSVPWGSGPVMTIGKPCINNALRPNITHSQKDLIEFQGDSGVGLVLNNHEDAQSMARIAPVVHQYDRCHRWIQKWFRHHPELFEATPRLAWK